MAEEIQPLDPTPIPLPPRGLPAYPVTPFNIWTWSTPVIPEFYWNVYSSEQRIKQICKEIGKIEDYLDYFANKANENHIKLAEQINEVERKLTERIAALEKKVEEEVARLDALIADLDARLKQEILDRIAADDALDDRIDQEIEDRTDADNSLHEEISTETTNRIHEDDRLHSEISQEVQDRIHADDALRELISDEQVDRIESDRDLWAAVNKRLTQADILGGNQIEVTKEPDSNKITISSTLEADITQLTTDLAALEAALDAEVSERRHDDTRLWEAVNDRIEKGKILAGPGISVVNDPDASTVTISATGGGGEAAGVTVTGEGPITVTESEDEDGKNYAVKLATSSGAWIDSADNVVTVKTFSAQNNAIFDRTLFGGALRSKPSAGVNGIYTDSTIKYGSSERDGVGFGVATGNGLEIDSAGKVAAKTATDTTPGIISENRVKEISQTSVPSINTIAPLESNNGILQLNSDRKTLDTENNKLKVKLDPAGPLKATDNGITATTVTTTSPGDTAGVVSPNTIKGLIDATSSTQAISPLYKDLNQNALGLNYDSSTLEMKGDKSLSVKTDPNGGLLPDETDAGVRMKLAPKTATTSTKENYQLNTPLTVDAEGLKIRAIDPDSTNDKVAGVVSRQILDKMGIKTPIVWNPNFLTKAYGGLNYNEHGLLYVSLYAAKEQTGTLDMPQGNPSVGLNLETDNYSSSGYTGGLRIRPQFRNYSRTTQLLNESTRHGYPWKVERYSLKDAGSIITGVVQGVSDLTDLDSGTVYHHCVDFYLYYDQLTSNFGIYVDVMAKLSPYGLYVVNELKPSVAASQFEVAAGVAVSAVTV